MKLKFYFNLEISRIFAKTDGFLNWTTKRLGNWFEVDSAIENSVFIDLGLN